MDVSVTWMWETFHAVHARPVTTVYIANHFIGRSRRSKAEKNLNLKKLKVCLNFILLL